MAFYESDGLKLYYEEHGKGDPLVLVHGFGGDRSFWVDVVDHYARYFRTIVIDLRGCGESDVPEIGYTPKELAFDVTQLMDHLGLDKIHFSGQSLGGAIGQEFAIAYPDKLISLSLHSTWAGGPVPHMKRWMDVRTKIIAENDPIMNAGTRAVSFFSPEWVDDHEDRLDAFNERMAANPHPITQKGIDAHGHAVLAHDTRDRVEQIAAPTLITVGTLDRATLPRQSRFLHEQIKDSELHFVEEGGHFTLFSHLDEFLTTSLGFLLKHAQS